MDGIYNETFFFHGHVSLPEYIFGNFSDFPPVLPALAFLLSLSPFAIKDEETEGPEAVEAAKGKKKKGKKRQELPGRPLEQDEPPGSMAYKPTFSLRNRAE